MASRILEFAIKLRNPSAKTVLVSLRRSLSTKPGKTQRRAIKTNTGETIFSRLSPLGNQNINMEPVLDRWVLEGHQAPFRDLHSIVRIFRSNGRYNHALQVLDWMNNNTFTKMSKANIEMKLGLIGKVHGVESAESYFNSISGVNKDGMGRLYSILLRCYTEERLVDKSLSLLQKMKDLGFTSTIAYNHIMSLYKDTDQCEKIPDVLLEMKKEGCLPNSISYRLCMESYGMRSDLDNMERILEEMESQTHITTEGFDYSLAAKFYIKAGDREKAVVHLKKCEELFGENVEGFSHLISHHANLGHKKEVIRLWKLQKAKSKKLLNMDYITIIGMLVKVEGLEVAEKIFKKWESSCKEYDFRVVNTLIVGYCQKGLTEKAESTLNKAIAKGKTPTPQSWSIVTNGYVNENNMERAFECIKKAAGLQTEPMKWKPKQTVVMTILDWLVDNRDADEVRFFINLMELVIPVDRAMYHGLIRAYIRSGKEVGEVLERMKSDGIEMDEETENLLKPQAV